MTKDTPTDSQADDWLNEIFWKLSCSPGTAGMSVQEAKAAIQTKLAEAERAAYDAGYDTRSLEADHEIEDAEKAAKKEVLERVLSKQFKIVTPFNITIDTGTGGEVSSHKVVAVADIEAELQHRQALNERSE